VHFKYVREAFGIWSTFVFTESRWFDLASGPMALDVLVLVAMSEISHC
jgi:hypothetical protein